MPDVLDAQSSWLAHPEVVGRPWKQFGQLGAIVPVLYRQAFFWPQSKFMPKLRRYLCPRWLLEWPLRGNAFESYDIPFLRVELLVVFEPNQSVCRDKKTLANLKAQFLDAVCDAVAWIRDRLNARDDYPAVGQIDAFNKTYTISAIARFVRE